MVEIESWLIGFELDAFIHGHVARVLAALPIHVRDDFIFDSEFRLTDYEPGPGVVLRVPFGTLRTSNPSRSVVLKRTLRHRPEAFVLYVIAHEFAHAHLHNRGRTPQEDPEHAADALASDWGFPRPTPV